MRRPKMCRMLCSLVLALWVVGAAGAAEPGLVGGWNFDEGPGPTAADASGNNNVGTLTGGVQWGARETGGALEFDGSSGYVRVPFGPTLKLLNQGDFTVAAWFKSDVVPTENKEVFQQGDANGSGRTWLYIGATSGEIRTFLGNAATNSGINVTPDTWFHAAVVVKEGGANDTVQVYVNGKPAGAAAQRGVENSEGPYFIGCHKNLTNFWDGQIDDVRLYKRALSAAEVKAMVPPKVKAQKPDPADGDVTVVTPLLRWTPGETAAVHSVYLGTDPNLGSKDLVQSRLPVTMYFHVPGLKPGTTYYWRVDEVEADLTTVYTGDVWTFTARAITAYLPTPADGANDASPDPNMTVRWQPGLNAIGHHVYFGDSRDTVRDGAKEVDKGSVTGTTFKPGALTPLTTYYWRVDETDPTNAVNKGPVWSFSTFLPVDDFERYTDKAGSEVFTSWVDGFTDGTNGSTVGYLTATNGTFGETKIVHGAKQAMPLDYNNIKSPFYSEAYQEFSPVQNWTADGADTLILYVRGNATNGLDTLYVALQDSTGKVGVVANANPNAVRAGTWTPWKIPLSGFTGVNVAKVKRLYIGVGDRKNPAQSGAGRLYIDDIRLTKP